MPCHRMSMVQNWLQSNRSRTRMDGRFRVPYYSGFLCDQHLLCSHNYNDNWIWRHISRFHYRKNFLPLHGVCGLWKFWIRLESNWLHHPRKQQIVRTIQKQSKRTHSVHATKERAQGSLVESENLPRIYLQNKAKQQSKPLSYLTKSYGKSKGKH